MCNIRISILTLLCGAFVLPAAAQQVLAGYNPLREVGVEVAGSPITAEALTDGDDMTSLYIENGSGTVLLFSFDNPFLVKGVNLVAGADLDKAPSRMVLYGKNSDSDDWTAIGRFNAGIDFSAPFTGFTGKTLASTIPYTEYKLEITRIRKSQDLEIAELELLGVPQSEENVVASTGEKTFRNVKASYGLENASLEYDFDNQVRISGYSFINNSNSSANARPRAWELLASEDGVEWVTLDMRANHGRMEADSYQYRHTLGIPSAKIDYADVADKLHEMLLEKFYYDYWGGKYLIHSWNPDPEKINYGYNYWWMAHAIDAYIDAYIRTGDKKYQTYARQIRQGMYVAYDANRLDLWNSFFDDMEWMNLACIRGYENLPLDRERWLSEAKQLFDWIWEGWNYDNGSEGGIRWNSGTGTGKNSCSNAPAMIGAAKLYQITGDEMYLEKAVMIFDWMLTHSRFDDGFIKDAPGNDNRGWAFTYNQGTWVGGLLELYRITGDNKYYDIAVDLMDKSMDSRWYSPDGIMREQGSSDGGLFKGIYIRYITAWVISGYLDPERQTRYASYLAENARSMYEAALHKPDMKVMPDWKTRADFSNGSNNGGTDGSYHSSIVLSGLFLCESMDMMRRARILDDDYSVRNPALERAYSHYKVNFTSNYGSNDLQLGGFALYGEDNSSAVERPIADSGIKIDVRRGAVTVRSEQPAVTDIFAADGRHLGHAEGTEVDLQLPEGVYIVKSVSSSDTSRVKVRVRK